MQCTRKRESDRLTCHLRAQHFSLCCITCCRQAGFLRLYCAALHPGNSVLQQIDLHAE